MLKIGKNGLITSVLTLNLFYLFTSIETQFISGTDIVPTAATNSFASASSKTDNNNNNGQQTFATSQSINSQQLANFTNPSSEPSNNFQNIPFPTATNSINPQQQQQQQEQQQQLTQPLESGNAINDEYKTFEQFKNSIYYLPPFDQQLISIPFVQRELVRTTMKDDFDLFRKILKEAVDKKNNLAPSVTLMFKYTPKLLTRFIKNRRDELSLPQHISYSPEYFKMLVNLLEKSIELSTEIKKEKKYTKKTVDTDLLISRQDSVLKWIENTINVSPLAAYLRWNETTLFKDDLTNPNQGKNLVDEISDLHAQFRGIGYESTNFVVKRIINLLNMFSRNSIPSLNDV